MRLVLPVDGRFDSTFVRFVLTCSTEFKCHSNHHDRSALRANLSRFCRPRKRHSLISTDTSRSPCSPRPWRVTADDRNDNLDRHFENSPRKKESNGTIDGRTNASHLNSLNDKFSFVFTADRHSRHREKREREREKTNLQETKKIFVHIETKANEEKILFEEKIEKGKKILFIEVLVLFVLSLYIYEKSRSGNKAGAMHVQT